MKNRFKMTWSNFLHNWNFLIFFILIFSALPSQQKEIRVGGIFNCMDCPIKLAFDYAILRSNINNQRIRLKPLIEYASINDSFTAGKRACKMVKAGIAGLFTEQSKSNSILKSVATNLEIPHFQTFWDPDQTLNLPECSKTVLNFYPDAGVLATAYADLLKKMEWTTFTIIYQHDDALIRLQEVLKLHGPKDSPITIRQLKNDPEVGYRSLLKEIGASSESHIVLDCDTDIILEVLQQAKEVKIMEDYQSYVIMSLDAHTIDFGEFKYGRTNVTAMRMVNPHNVEVKEAIHMMKIGEMYKGKNINISAETVRLETALTFDAVEFFASVLDKLNVDEFELQPLSCNNISTWFHGYRISQQIKHETRHGLTGEIRLDSSSGSRKDFTLEVIELARDGFVKIGTWDPHIGVNYSRSYSEIYTQIVESLHNKTFKVASRIGAPYLMNRVAQHGEKLEGNSRYEGYAMDLIDGISKILGFQYEFELVPDQAYGSYDKKTKKWDGLIKHLLDRQADLAICDLTITYERRSAVDFTMPFMTLGISILFSKPTKQPPNLFSFMSPLSVDVWIYMITAFLGVSIFLYIIARMNPQDWENPHPCNPDPEELENIWGLKNTVWLTLGSIMAQGCDILPKGSSTRFATGTWWFFSMIMIASYTANLAAFLTMEKMDATIQNVNDLAKQTKIKYGAVKGGSTGAFFKDSNDSMYQKIWSVMESTKPSVFTLSNNEGVERVSKGKNLYAFFMESTSIEYQIERNCDLTQIGGLLDSKGYGIAMPTNSPYRTLISGAVLKMQEDGKLHLLKTKWWKEKDGGGSCSDTEKHDEMGANELGIDNVGGVFVVLGLGCACAFGVALLEFLWNVRKVAVDNMISPCEALMCELKFALQICNTTKPVNTKTSMDSNNSSRASGVSDNRSIAANMLKTAGSFLHLDTMFEKK